MTRSSEQAKALLTLDQAVIGYAKPVIGPLSFSVHGGERVGIWGPNGSGKSSLLNHFLGQARLLSGRATLRSGLRLAYQAQVPVRLEQMPITGREYLRLLAAPAHPALDGALDDGAVDLGQRVDRLSGGQFQWLYVRAVLATPADLYLLDEPTNNLDPAAIARLQQALTALTADRAAILVSHERDFLTQVATRIIEVSPCR